MNNQRLVVGVRLLLILCAMAGPRSCLLQAQTASHEQATSNTLTMKSGDVSPAASINDFAWIAGDWSGKAMGGQFEESWNPPSGGTMMGFFKFINAEGETQFSEILILMADGDSIVLRLKHFDGSLHGWEEKDETVDFPLVKLTHNAAFFDGLTFRRKGNDSLSIFVRMNREGDSVAEIEFAGKRMTPPEGVAGIGARRQAVDRILAIDSVSAGTRDELSRHMPAAAAVRLYVTSFDRVDWSGVPEDFRQGFQEHLAAWREFVPVLEGFPDMRGELHELLDQIKELHPDQLAELERGLSRIWKTWAKVESSVERLSESEHDK